MIGLVAWMLFVEHLLPAEAARYTPGAGGLSLAINAAKTPLGDSVPGLAVGAVVLVSCAAAASVAGWRAALQRDAA